MGLFVYEIFQSIQGESSFAGLPFTFVRLAGCNLKCRWCDTVDSISAVGKRYTVQSILERIETSGLKHVCITGGEPLAQTECIDLLDRLVRSGFITTLETNGSLDIRNVPPMVHRIVDVKCPSSGMESCNRYENLNLLDERDEVKYVIADRDDYVFASDSYSKHLHNFKGTVIFSPVLTLLKPQDLAKWVLSDRIPVRVQIQLHKMLDIK